MSNSMTAESVAATPKRDVGGIVCSALFILLGAACLYETTQMTDPDSYVFPRMVIAGLMGLSLLLIVNSLLKPVAVESEEQAEADEAEPSTPRRVLLMVAMIAATLVMPWTGFLISGLGVFISLMFLAQYDPWTKSKLWVYTLVAVAVVCGFFAIFSFLLNVPLPEGVLISLS